MLAWLNGYVIVEPNNNKKKYRQRAKSYLQQSMEREYVHSDMSNIVKLRPKWWSN